MARYDNISFYLLGSDVEYVVTGIMNIVFASGSAAGAPLGGLLADSIGWRW